MDQAPAVQAAIERHGLLRPGQAVLVAVSGGPDSLCLLDCLRRLDFRPVVAHFDHGMRRESAKEARWVQSLAQEWGLPVELGRGDVPLERKGGGSMEEVARRLRYRFLAQAASRHEARVVATAHTADDQVETILMHLLRGAGPSGLRGMLPTSQLAEWAGVPEAAGLRLIRPLLGVWRSEVEAHCVERGLNPLIDPSNLDPRFHRNRLRHELLPILQGYNPGVRRSLLRTANIMAAEHELIQSLTDAAWPRLVRRAGPGCLGLNRQGLLQEPLALQRAIVRRAVQELRPALRDVGFEAVEAALAFAADAQARRKTLVGGLDLVGLKDELVLRLPGSAVRFPWFPQLAGAEPQRLPTPTSLALADGWELTVGLWQPPAADHAAGDQRKEATIDASSVQGDLQVRPPQPGDRIRPLGMQGSVKLAELFSHRSIPWPARARWPVVVDDASVIWVAGLHLSRDHRLREGTTQAVVLRLSVRHAAHEPKPAA